MLAETGARVPQRGIKRLSVVDQLTKHLRTRILSGEWKEGYQLRQESIAEEYEVSRMPVREALRQLEAENLILFQQNKGAVVAGLSPEEIEELFDLRANLEVSLASQAIKNFAAPSLQEAEEALAEMRLAESKEHIGDWGTLNWNFHEALYKPANRPHTLSVVHRLNQHTSRYVAMHLMLGKRSYQEAHKEHSLILETFKANDKVGIKKLLKKHILDAKSDLLAVIASE